MTKHVIWRFNEKENKPKYIKKIQKLKHVSSRTPQNLKEKLKIGSKIFILGSCKLRNRGFMAMGIIKKIRKVSCDDNDNKIKMFTDSVKEYRKAKQWRLTIKITKIYEPNQVQLHYRSTQQPKIINKNAKDSLIEDLESYEKDF